MRKIILASAALFVGVLAGGVLVGRATAQQPPPQGYAQPQGYSPRFQYQCMTKWNDKYWSPEIAAQLNGMGAQGFRWMSEIRTDNRDVYCFERRM
jgi:hypothetical protein